MRRDLFLSVHTLVGKGSCSCCRSQSDCVLCSRTYLSAERLLQPVGFLQVIQKACDVHRYVLCPGECKHGEIERVK